MHWGAPAPDILRGLADLQAENARSHKLPPVDSWNPPYCGELDIRIAVDGTWYYLGTPIGRPGLVRLFSTILRRDDDGRFYLVTPVEKVGIQVADAPFLAVRVDIQGNGKDQLLVFTTNAGDAVEAGLDHPFCVRYPGAAGEPRPYLHVRGRLEALVSRAVFYELVDRSEERDTPEGPQLGLWSGGKFFTLGSAIQ